MVRAAVLSAPGESLRVAELELPEPGPGQVRVRLAAAGVCHSDLSLARGLFHFARTLQGCVYGSPTRSWTSRRCSSTPPRAGSTSARPSAAPSAWPGIDGAIADMEAGRGARTLVVP